jgi:hypothetical protein
VLFAFGKNAKKAGAAHRDYNNQRGPPIAIKITRQNSVA